MIDEATVRRIVLSFPEATESSHHGTPDFRSRNKIFATLPPGKDYAVLKLPPELHPSLIAGNPNGFQRNGWSKHGWIEVVLDQIDEQQFEALAEEAWKEVAPKTLVKTWEQA